MAPKQGIPTQGKVFDASAMAKTYAPISAPKPAHKAVERMPDRAISNSTKPKTGKPQPRMDLLSPGDPVGFDAEFQDFKLPNCGWQSRLGWSAAVNSKGEIIFAAYSRYEDDDPPGTQYKLPNSKYGVTWKNLRYNNGALHGQYVEKVFKRIFAGRTVVVHDGKGDKAAFQYESAFGAATHVIDTQILCRRLQSDETPGLAKLANLLLGKTIQGGGKGNHSPIEDAQTTIEVFMKEKGDRTDDEIEQEQEAWRAEKARKKAVKKAAREAQVQQDEGAMGWLI